MSYKEKALATGLIKLKEGETILDHIDFLNMHLPYSNMGKKALSYLLRREWRGLPRWKRIIEQTGMEEPVPKDPRGTKEYQTFYEDKLASSLIASSMIGNLYTASLYLGFRSCLEFEFQKGVELEGKRVGFGSYGSGSSAMVFSGVILPRYKEIVKDMNLEAEIGNRVKLSLEEYEAIHENKRGPQQNFLESKKEFILLDVENTPESRGERRYVYNG